MLRRSHRRLIASLRFLALAVLVLALLLRPVLSSLGEIHELAHDPSGQHLDIEHGSGPSTHDAPRENREGKGANALHARDLAFGWIAQTLDSQSVLLAYIDVFWLSALFAAAMVPVALLLLKRVDLSAGRPAVH